MPRRRDEAESTFSTGFNATCGVLVAIAVAGLLLTAVPVVLCLGVGGFGAHQLVKDEPTVRVSPALPAPAAPAPTKTAAAAAPASRPPEPKAAAEPSPPAIIERIGAVRVGIASANPARYPALGMENVFYQVTIRVENTTDTVKVDYVGWGASAELVDNFGNYYRRIRHPYPGYQGGQVIASAIQPGRPLADNLLFESPIPRAEQLFLVLPAKNVGEEGLFRLRIDGPATLERRAAAEAEDKRIREQAAAEIRERERREAEARKAELAEKAKKLRAEVEAANEEREREAKAEERAEANLRYAKRLFDQRKSDDAHERLRKIIKDYPDTKAAKEAKKLLEDTGGSP
jgi:hypothetical protein